jgi:ribosomal-protein-alanine N-acetyltransferase
MGQKGVLRYFPNPQPPERERVNQFIISQLNHWEEHGFGWWAVELKNTDELNVVVDTNLSLIGWNGLQYLPDTDEVEVGYLLARPYWGYGLAAEGARPAIKMGFEAFGLKEIVGIVHPENTASVRVLEKIGMSFTCQAHYFGMPVRRYAIRRLEFERG